MKPVSGGVALLAADEWQSFDHVVLACHSDQALALLDNPGQQAQQVLSAIRYQGNQVTLHCDDSFMPTRRKAWASWNLLAGDAAEERLPRVTYSMNILQSIASSKPLLVSLNADELIAPEKVIRQFTYTHPVYSVASRSAQKQRDKICGIANIHYCGAYWYNGFHEDGVRSALDVCARFGESL